jgi:lysophospholipase L1-like esterase
MSSPIRLFLGLALALTLLFPQTAPSQNKEVATQTTEVSKPVLNKWQQIWSDRVDLFNAENKELDPEVKNIVFLGDSLTHGFKVSEYLPDLPVLNRGIGADGVANYPEAKTNYRGVTQRLDACIFECNPSHLFFLIGTNDVGNRTIPIEYWFGAYKYVVEQAEKKVPGIEIILITAPPTGTSYKRNKTLNPRLMKWNEMIKEYALEKDLRVLDLYSLLVSDGGLMPDEMTRDGLHFNHIGYERWTNSIKEILKEDGVIKEIVEK